MGSTGEPDVDLERLDGAMNARLFARIRSMFDAPVMQNSLRGLWAEVMVSELLGAEWHHTGNDWAGWDLQRHDGARIEVKQSAKLQTWGEVSNRPRFNISAAKGHYPDGKIYVENTNGQRLADTYIFAWHAGEDQRKPSEWSFYVVASSLLPAAQKTLGLTVIQSLVEPVPPTKLREKVEKTISSRF